MVALKGSEVENFLARPTRPIVLIFGPDAGLVRERAEALVRQSVDDPKDPFQLARLDGDDLSSEPTRLVDEANTIPLFGGRRAVWIKAGARNFAPALEALIAAPPPNCRILIEAGDLKRNAPLRAVCERAKTAAALPCYPDTEKDLIRLIDQEMGEAGLAISPEARAALEQRLARSCRPHYGMWHSCIGRGCRSTKATRSPRPPKASSHSFISIASVSSKLSSGPGHRHG